jgi:dihydroflavonol-4-reductase
MTHPAAKGERFIATSGSCMTMQEMAFLLKERLGEAARRVPTRMVPNWVVKFISMFDRSVAQIVPDLGKSINATNEKARRVLDWQPRPREEAVIATAESLVKLNLLPNLK